MENYARDSRFGFNVSWGELIYVPSAKMEEEGFSLVLKQMHGFDEREANDVSELTRMPRKESNAFLRRHLCVYVALIDNKTKLRFSPMQSTKRGGCIGEPYDAFCIDLPTDSGMFYRELTRAFDCCMQKES